MKTFRTLLICGALFALATLLSGCATSRPPSGHGASVIEEPKKTTAWDVLNIIASLVYPSFAANGEEQSAGMGRH